jgi:hypothetical protein
MPAIELSATPQSLGTWTVVGRCRHGVVTHLAVLAEDCLDVVSGQEVPVHHMGPPLTSLVPSPTDSEDNPELAVEGNFSRDQLKVHVAAWLGDLDDDDRQGMRRWYRQVCALFPTTLCPKWPSIRRGVEPVLAEFFAQCHYVADPPFRIESDPVSRADKAHWYSCAGFVIACYESAPVHLLLIDRLTPDFPKIDKDTVKEIFIPPGLTFTEEIAKAINLLGDGPWPVVMPGYVIRAFLNRSDKVVRTVPYSPKRDDTRFRSR